MLMKLCIVIYIWMELCVWMELACVWTMCMDETDVICDMCWICDMWYVLDMWYVICARYVLDMCWIWNLYMWYVLQIVGFNKKQKKQTICRLFAVCHRQQRALCRLPRMAKKARGIQLCFLGADPFGQFAYSGRRQRVNNFAVSGGRQRSAVSHLTDWQRNYCHPPSLPSAADGKESAADGKEGRRQ